MINWLRKLKIKQKKCKSILINKKGKVSKEAIRKEED